MTHLETIVSNVVLELIRRNAPATTHVDLDDELVNKLGLQSLDIAELAAVLEEKFQYDPFANGYPVGRLRTIRDLCVAYDHKNLEDPREP